MIHNIDQVVPSSCALIIQVTHLRKHFDDDFTQFDERLLGNSSSLVVPSHLVQHAYDFLDASLLAETVNRNCENIPVEFQASYECQIRLRGN